jgi:hypothetical protein
MYQKITDLLKDSPGGVYCLDNHKSLNKQRHAEECLVDVAEHIEELGKANGVAVSTSVNGKKRPCITCSGRMTGVVDKFSSNPGLLWLHAAGKQPAEVAKRSYEVALTKQSNVTQDGRGRDAPAYDSGSDNTDYNGELTFS